MKNSGLRWNFGTVFVLTITLVIIVAGVTASFYEYYSLPQDKNQVYTTSLAVKCWRSFSFYSNISEAFNTEILNKTRQIDSIHCIRFFSCCWIIIFHSYMMFIILSCKSFQFF
uniref:Uncharacterized protein n=1 Tax=Acrobeloides nanus TaxID=290746 RepID=A0A914BZ67_9BILA